MLSNRSSTRWLVVVALVMAGCLVPAPLMWAFSFQPMVTVFSPAGRESTQTFQVENTTNEAIAVEISMVTRAIDVAGNEINEPASHLFSVFPSQIVLRPGAVQTVRVQWIGPEVLRSEQSYRIVAEQLPINLRREQSDQSAIRVLLRYLGSVYVRPPAAAPRVEVVSVTKNSDEPEPRLEITLRNSGGAHHILSPITLALRFNGGPPIPISLGEPQLPGLWGQNLLAGGLRRFLVPWPAELPLEAVGMRIEIDLGTGAGTR